jgi:hypothetical protein
MTEPRGIFVDSGHRLMGIVPFRPSLILLVRKKRRGRTYPEGMKRIATLRVTQAVARYGEHAPAATACCNACRTCVTTNLVGIATAVFAGTGLAAVRTGRRLLQR